METTIRIFHPTSRRRARTAAGAAALILTGATACDNVSWGGVDVAVIPPPPVREEAAPARPAGPPGAIELPVGPVLYRVRADTAGAEIVPVGEISGDSLLALGRVDEVDRYWMRFVADLMRQGTELALYRRGRRVGTAIVREAMPPSPGTCPALPAARGLLELSAGGRGEEEFLALPKRYLPEAVSAPPDSAREAQARRRSLIVGPILAERMLRARRAGLPGNWQAALRQIVPFPAGGARDPAFAASLLVGDTLGPGLDDVGYSLFFVAAPSQDLTGAGYDTVYVDFAHYPETGKAGRRVVDFLDWDRDGHAELLLEVFGTEERWLEVVGRGEEAGWRRSFTLRCVAPEIAEAERMAADSVAADTIAGSAPPSSRAERGPGQ